MMEARTQAPAWEAASADAGSVRTEPSQLGRYPGFHRFGRRSPRRFSRSGPAPETRRGEMSVPPQVVDVLIRAGRQPTLDVGSIPAELESIRNEDHIDRLHWRDWDDVTQPIVLEDVVALVKSLVICEERFAWGGGSVSAIIWVYREIKRRDHVLAEDIAEWILLRTSNLGFRSDQ